MTARVLIATIIGAVVAAVAATLVLLAFDVRDAGVIGGAVGGCLGGVTGASVVKRRDAASSAENTTD